MLNLVSPNSLNIPPTQFEVSFTLQLEGVVVAVVNHNHNHYELELAIYKVGILKIIVEPKTATMYHMHPFVTSTCIHVVHSGEFRFGECFEYAYFN